jgi:hypothetical protein
MGEVGKANCGELCLTLQELRINKVVEKVVRELVKEYEITKWFAFSDTGYDVVKYVTTRTSY